MFRRHQYTIRIISLLALTAGVYFWVFYAPYSTWDDYRLIAENPWMDAPFRQALAKFWGDFIEGDYTPIPHTSYWLEIFFFGKNPIVHHTSNIAIHLLNIALLSRLIIREKIAPGLAQWICLCFALHPLQVEAVAWISDRNALMNATAVLFGLLSLQNISSSKRKSIWALVYALCFLIAGFCKASSIFLPLAIGLALFFSRRGSQRANILLHTLTFLIICAPFAWIRRLALLSKVGPAWDFPLNYERFALLGRQIPTAIGHYYRSFFWPIHLSPIYPSFEALAEGWLPLFILGLVISLLWLTWVIRRRDFYNSLAILWFFSLLFPVLNIFPRAIFVNDRYMYLPLIGLSYASGSGFFALIERFEKLWPSWPFVNRRLPKAAIGLLLLVLCLLSWEQCKIWTDDLLFWRKATNESPQSPLAWNNLAVTARFRKDYRTAVESLEKALSLPPDVTSPRAVLWQNLGDLYFSQDWPQGFQVDKALASYQQALQENPRSAEDYSILVIKYASTLAYNHRENEARAILQKLLTQSENLSPAVQNEAARLLRKLRIDPETTPHP